MGCFSVPVVDSSLSDKMFDIPEDHLVNDRRSRGENAIGRPPGRFVGASPTMALVECGEDADVILPPDLIDCLSPMARWLGLRPTATLVAHPEVDACSWVPLVNLDEGAQEDADLNTKWHSQTRMSGHIPRVGVRGERIPEECSSTFAPPGSASSSSSCCVFPSTSIEEEIPTTGLTGLRLSKSAARRRRRERASAYSDAVADQSCDETSGTQDTSTMLVTGSSSTSWSSDKLNQGGGVRSPYAQAVGGIASEPYHHNISTMAQGFDRMWIADLTGELRAGGKARARALVEVSIVVLPLAFDALGCRLVQEALDVADQREAATLAGGLHGGVRALVLSPHGNYVVQKVIQVLPGALASFIPLELFDVASDVARHRYGCRILCRLLEHASSELATVNLIGRALVEVGDLCVHQYGHHVVEAALEHASRQQQARIISVLIAHPRRYSTHRYAAYVIVKALEYYHDPVGIAIALGEDAELLSVLSQHRYGHQIFRALVRLQCSRRFIERAYEKIAFGPQASTCLKNS